MINPRTPALHSRPVLDRLVLATHNRGKVAEIRPMLAGYVQELVCAADLGLPEPEETGTTFAENACLKAQAACRASGLPALADDSGLCVRALDGAPGIYSARWAEPNRNFQIAMERVHQQLGSATDQSAFFVCVLALAFPDGQTETFEGRVDGQIVWPPRGTQGFGYDPIFVPDGFSKTFSEMGPGEKDRLSHRRRAFDTLVKGLFLV